jgi:hypothetical protein
MAMDVVQQPKVDLAIGFDGFRVKTNTPSASLIESCGSTQ